MGSITITELSEEITIQQPTLTADGYGGQSTSWAALSPDPVWAKVVSESSSPESLVAGSIRALQKYAITVRYRADLAPGMRVLWTIYGATTPKTLTVQTIDVDDRERLILHAMEAL